MNDTKEKRFKVPTIHLNGTSKEELLDQVVAAVRGCRKAMEAIRTAWPNGRDYYIQGPDAFGQAVEEWKSRVERIDSVMKELTEIGRAIADHGKTT
jgi:hypothetical protein